MKRKWTGILGVLLFGCLCLFTACNAPGKIENDENKNDQETTIDVSEKLIFTLNEEKTAYSVTGMDVSAEGSVSIPSEYNNLPVTNIEDGVFYGCDGLVSIHIPSSIENIGGALLYNCSSIEKIEVEKGNSFYHSNGNCLIETQTGTLKAGCKNSEIPNDGSVLCLAAGAFGGCSGLTEIYIPDSITVVEAGAFENCSGLESITVGQANLAYRSEGNCLIDKEKKEILVGCKNSEIPKDGSVTAIGDFAFYGCSGLKKIVIPLGITKIGRSAFSYCRGLEELELPDSVTDISEFAFSGCTGVKSIFIGKGVTSIGRFAFCNGTCAALETIEVKEGNTFYQSKGNCLIERTSKTLVLGCNNSIIPEDGSVIGIGSEAFESCDRMAYIVIPKSITSIHSEAFYNCDSLNKIYYGGTQMEWNAVNFGYSETINKARIYFYSEEKPMEAGDFWRYENGVPMIWESV